MVQRWLSTARRGTFTQSSQVFGALLNERPFSSEQNRDRELKDKGKSKTILRYNWAPVCKWCSQKYSDDIKQWWDGRLKTGFREDWALLCEVCSSTGPRGVWANVTLGNLEQDREKSEHSRARCAHQKDPGKNEQGMPKEFRKKNNREVCARSYKGNLPTRPKENWVRIG